MCLRFEQTVGGGIVEGLNIRVHINSVFGFKEKHISSISARSKIVDFSDPNTALVQSLIMVPTEVDSPI